MPAAGGPQAWYRLSTGFAIGTPLIAFHWAVIGKACLYSAISREGFFIEDDMR